MFAKSKIVRLSLWACLAATWLPIGNGVLEPTQAQAWVVRGGVYRPGYAFVGPRYVAPAPVVVTPPVVAPTVVAPAVVAPRVVYHPGYWGGYRWFRR